MRAQEFANSKLVIFDIDDTLVNTDTRVNVVRDGKVIKQLNSHDFTHYKLGPGESFDFGAFQDAREFFTKAQPIPGMIRQLKHDIATGNRVIMLTARSDFNDRDIFLDTFRRFGIDMDRVHVYRAGNLAIKAATEEKKKIILRHLLGKEHFDKLIMYDDSVPNLNAFMSLKQEYPWSKFYAWHVDPNGQASEYGRTNESANNDLDEVKILSQVKGKGSEPRQLPRYGRPIEPEKEHWFLGKKVGNFEGYSVWRDWWGGQLSYHLFDPRTRIAILTTFGSQYKDNPASYIIHGLYAAPGNTVKAHQFYRNLIVDQGLTLVSDRKQSPGGNRVWQRLEAYPDVTVYGYDTKTGKLLNFGARDSEMYAVPAQATTSPENKYIANNLRLVATAKRS